jgi:DNA-binding response OmpR family regulator
VVSLSSGESGATVMLVEDDDAIARTLTDALDSADYRVWLASNGAEARTLLEQTTPDLIILDLMLPDIDGLVLCSTLRAATDAPIVICSATADRRDAVLGLKLGADDFIPKPFDIYELEARLAAVLRRAARSVDSAPPNEVRVGELVIDRSRRRVTLGGRQIQLTPTEFRLVSTLAGRADQILSRQELAMAVWGYEDSSAGRTIDVHIRRLRVKLKSARVSPPPIVAVRGFGYRMGAEHS